MQCEVLHYTGSHNWKENYVCPCALTLFINLLEVTTPGIIYCILKLLGNFQTVGLACHFAFEEHICQSLGRKAANLLNGVTLMNSLLCQTFLQKKKRELEDEGRMGGRR